jgi:uncharacterized membrane protein YgcG
MDPTRIFRHLLMTRWRVRKAFSVRVLSAIDSAIRESHRSHAGQVRFVVEGALDSSDLFDGLTARERAIDVFSQLRVWDTEDNNGILIYLLLADRDVEIVADRGINARVSGDEWEAVCRMMEAEFRRGKYQSGAIRGIEQVSALLQAHFPTRTPPREDLPSFPVVM